MSTGERPHASSRRPGDGRGRRRRQISAAELLDLHLARIAERNPELNAIVSLDEERARAGAAAADRVPADQRGPLHGLPFAFKDTHDVAGWRTTYGSPLFADHVPEDDDLVVERIRAAGRGTAREDQRAGVRGRLPHVQHDLRHHAQPGRPDPLGRRLERRRRVRAGRGHGAARGRLRHGRLAAQPGVVLRRRRAAALARPGPVVADDNLWETTAVGGPMARNVGRPRAAAVGDRRARPAGADRARRPGSPVRAAGAGLDCSGSGSRCRSTSAGAFEVDDEVASVVEASAAVLSQAGASVASA